mgnify:CR=1 FL=1
MSQPSPVAISPVEDIIAEMRAGRMVILVDEEDRENEGDLVLAADHVTPEAINFMARFGRGLICLTLTRERCAQLRLPLMVSDTDLEQRTNFTLSIEAAEGVPLVTLPYFETFLVAAIDAALQRHGVEVRPIQPYRQFPEIG